MVGLALARWPTLAQWLVERVQAHMVSSEETWLKRRGRWHDWCVVLDGPTELPVLAA